MKREPAEPLRLDYLIKAGAVHSMTGETYRSVGLRGPEIVAVSAEPDGLDDLAGLDTAVVDAGDLTVVPAFADSHEHLIEATSTGISSVLRLARTAVPVLPAGGAIGLVLSRGRLRSGLAVVVETLAEELEPRGIRVNGLITGRCGTSDGFARAATFVLSPAASYLTGNVITTNDGDRRGHLARVF